MDSGRARALCICLLLYVRRPPPGVVHAGIKKGTKPECPRASQGESGVWDHFPSGVSAGFSSVDPAVGSGVVAPGVGIGGGVIVFIGVGGGGMLAGLEGGADSMQPIANAVKATTRANPSNLFMNAFLQ